MPRAKDKPPQEDNGPLLIPPGEFWTGVDNGEFVIEPTSVRNVAKVESVRRESREGEVSLPRAEDIMGPELFRGPDQVEQVYGFRPEVLPITCSVEEMTRAKELGQRLILRSGIDGAGEVLSLSRIQEILGPRFKSKKQAILDTPDIWQHLVGTERFVKGAPRPGWAFSSIEPLAGTTGNDYISQTDELITHLKTQVFQNLALPTEYQEAILEYESQRQELVALVVSDWALAAKRLSTLKITQLFRTTEIENVFDSMLEFGLRSTHPKSRTYNWTSSLSVAGGLVGVGNFDAQGVHGNGWRPGRRYDVVGVSFSRRLLRQAGV